MSNAQNATRPTHTSADERRACLTASVDNEVSRLEAVNGEANAPLGGWRNRAIGNIAAYEGMNPYTLDHLIRGV